MKLYENLKVDFEYHDIRGRLIQVVHDGYSQINILESKKGVMRGEHYHKIAKEAFFVVSGSVEVFLKQDNQKEHIIFKTGDFFQITPDTVHSLFFPEDCILLAMYDKPIEKKNGMKDIYSLKSEVFE